MRRRAFFSFVEARLPFCVARLATVASESDLECASDARGDAPSLLVALPPPPRSLLDPRLEPRLLLDVGLRGGELEQRALLLEIDLRLHRRVGLRGGGG